MTATLLKMDDFQKRGTVGALVKRVQQMNPECCA